MKPALWFVTPAHGRLDITQQTLAQRANLNRRTGTRCVVVAEDENLNIAEDLGLDAVKCPNTFLGEKFNVGVQYAIEEGASHITLFDSDSISLDAVYNPLSDSPEYRPYYSFVVPDGSRRGELTHMRWVQTIWPVEFMKLTKGQPCDQFINKHVSSSCLRNIAMVCKAYGREFTPVYAKTHPLEHVGFQSEDNISEVYSIMNSAVTGRWKYDVWDPLLETYTEDQDQILALKNYYERKSLV